MLPPITKLSSVRLIKISAACKELICKHANDSMDRVIRPAPLSGGFVWLMPDDIFEYLCSIKQVGETLSDTIIRRVTELGITLEPDA